jgi:hypothetical protein
MQEQEQENHTEREINPRWRFLEWAIGCYSEEYYSAGWYHGIEYILWNAVLDYRRIQPDKEARDAEAQTIGIGQTVSEEFPHDFALIAGLSMLSEVYGGWVYWHETPLDQRTDVFDLNAGVRFVHLEDWQVMYEKWLENVKQ